MTRSKQDVDKLTNFFTTCGLFSPDTTLRCIVTGAVAPTSVTVDEAQSTRIHWSEDIERYDGSRSWLIHLPDAM